jgi:predicted nucleic acid-binding protein
LRVDDALIAATAWVKRLPLLTRNRKHYEFIAEITLMDLPQAPR